MNLRKSVHELVVYRRRVRVLCRHLLHLLPTDATLLDVGCGDGLLARMILDSKPGVRIEGIDALVRPHTHIPVMPFDGRHVPYQDRSVDVVLLVDVLHHTRDPMVMLKEARRVARNAIVIKDHTRNGFLAKATLCFMDWVGNAHYGVPLPYNYWSRKQWYEAFDQLNLKIDQWNRRIGLYPIPADWIFGRSLHFIARLHPGDAD